METIPWPWLGFLRKSISSQSLGNGNWQVLTTYPEQPKDSTYQLKHAVLEAATICPRLACDLNLLTLKVVTESRVTWATSVPILVFLGLSVLNLGPMYATDVRQTDVRRASSLNVPRHNKLFRRPPQYAQPPVRDLIFDLLTLQVVSVSRVTWATSVPILVFLGLFST